jgi:hypothetical protein
MPEPDKKPAVPLGAPLSLTDEELDTLAEITEDDIAAAKALWRQAVPYEIKDLLDAVEVDE